MMDELFNIHCVEQMFDFLGHQFANRELVRLALTAAGADSANHDGNRQLAFLGQAVMSLVAVNGSYGNVSSRGQYSAVHRQSEANLTQRI